MNPVVISNATLSGIYTITNTVNGKVYVGSAVHFARRWITHQSALRCGKHGSPKLQAAWNKYGAEAFEFLPVEVVDDKADLLRREQAWLDRLMAAECGYNILPVAGSRLGTKHSPETREKLKAKRRARISKPCSDATKQKLSAAQKGRAKPPVSDEYRALMSRAMRGVRKPPRTEAQRAMAAAIQTGKQASAETRQRMSVAQAKRWERERANEL